MTEVGQHHQVAVLGFVFKTFHHPVDHLRSGCLGVDVIHREKLAQILPFADRLHVALLDDGDKARIPDGGIGILGEMLTQSSLKPGLRPQEGNQPDAHGELSDMAIHSQGPACLGFLLKKPARDDPVFRGESLHLDEGIAVENGVTHDQHTQISKSVDGFQEVLGRITGP